MLRTTFLPELSSLVPLQTVKAASITAMACHIVGWLYLLKLWQLIFANLLAVGTAEGKSAFLILFQCGGNISLQDGALPFLLR